MGYDLFMIKVFLVGLAFYFLYRLRIYQLYRRQMESMIDEMEGGGEFLLEINAYQFTLSNDLWQMSENFAGIRDLNITEKGITFRTSQDYSFPKESMTAQDFELLSHILRERVKAGNA
jgi:hypothetical protein